MIYRGTDANDTLHGLSNQPNYIKSGAGNDTLTGGNKGDILEGGTGNDLYIKKNDGSCDFIRDHHGDADVLQLSETASNRLWFRHIDDDLEVSRIGTTDKVVIEDWYQGTQNHIEQIKAGDGRVLASQNVDKLVQAMAAFSIPAAGQTSLPADYQSALGPILAVNWK